MIAVRVLLVWIPVRLPTFLHPFIKPSPTHTHPHCFT